MRVAKSIRQPRKNHKTKSELSQNIVACCKVPLTKPKWKSPDAQKIVIIRIEDLPEKVLDRSPKKTLVSSTMVHLVQKTTKVKKTPRNFITESGHFTEPHEVVTEDGYILSLLRLRRKEASVIIQINDEEVEEVKDRPVVVFVHGLFCRGDHWCLIPADKGLPYQLLELGYDVWLLNLRGTNPSQRHTSLSPKSKKFWNFSFHEIGIYDLPATIDDILNVTGQTSLTYIGHSMGCSVLLVLLSTKPEYCSKISRFVALAPAVFGENIRKLGFLSFVHLGNALGGSKFLRVRRVGSSPISKQVRGEKVGAWALKRFGRMMGAFGQGGVEKERLRSLSSVWPEPTSLKLVCHGLQCLKENRARQYNYGRRGNLETYGGQEPPSYDFAKVEVPTLLFYSEGDEMCRPKDVMQLVASLPNVSQAVHILEEDFSHTDFMLGSRAHELVYRKVLELMMVK